MYKSSVRCCLQTPVSPRHRCLFPINSTTTRSRLPLLRATVFGATSLHHISFIQHSARLYSNDNILVHSVSGSVSKSELWWEKDAQFWVDVSSAKDLLRELEAPGVELCVVDWFATWCHGCRKSSVHMTKLASDPVLNTRIKFIRACADGMSAFARAQGVKSLPFLSIYSNTGQKLLAFGATASKSQVVRKNVEIALDNPDKDFRLDANGIAIALDPVISKKSEKTHQQELEELRKFKKSISDKLNSNPLPSKSFSLSDGELSVDADEGEEDAELTEERKQFLTAHGDSYGYHGLLNSIYDFELGRRLGDGQHYLDYTGSSVYTETQLTAIMKDFRENIFGNPHSANPSSSLTRDRIEEVRRLVLEFFDADPRQYQVIFTKSATAALKTIGETYPWTENSVFRYLRENHNSVLGIREYVLKHGGSFEDVTEDQVDQWIAEQSPIAEVSGSDSEEEESPTYHLFAFPAEDNFAGVKYPLDWIEGVQNRSTKKDVWKVMLDAAAFVGTQRLSLRQHPADYVAISFYKVFGYPTGLGALIVRVEDIDILQKVFWAGGSVALATSHSNFHVLKCRPTERLEDGTVAFLDIISLKHGFDVIKRVGGIDRINDHVWSLTEWLYTRMSSLRHSNGRPIIKVFGKHGLSDSRRLQGSILNFELLGADGNGLSYKTFERDAATAGFHIRTGNECNPGAAYNYLGIRESEVETLAGLTEGCDDELEYIQVTRPNENLLVPIKDSTTNEPGSKLVNLPLGSVRVSLGYMSTFEDCQKFSKFLEAKCRDQVVEG